MQKTAFFEELRLRLNMVTASFKDLNPQRMRCLLLIVRTAVRVHNTAAKHDIYDFLVEFCTSVGVFFDLNEIGFSLAQLPAQS